jgi:hypothetical protein
MFIPDPGSYFSCIHPGSQKASDPGSGPATLVKIGKRKVDFNSKYCKPIMYFQEITRVEICVRNLCIFMVIF